MKILGIIILLIAAGAGYFYFGKGDKNLQVTSSANIENRLESAARSLVVREIENPECVKLLNNIKEKTSATVQKISPQGHEVLLAHAETKSTISLDCSQPSKMSMTFISNDASLTPEWFKVIGDASDILVNKSSAAVIGEAKKCLALAKRDPTTSAEEDEGGIDIDCSLPGDNEKGFLVAVMAGDASKTMPEPPQTKVKAVEKPHKSGKNHK